jgi:hypothetical protein
MVVEDFVSGMIRIAPLVGMLGSLVTTLVAVFVFREAKAIRQADWRSRNNERWSQFNDFILRYDYSHRWGEIIRGRVDWGDLEQKDFQVIYQFLNVLSHQYQLGKIQLMPWQYVRKSVGDNILYFDHFWDELNSHLRIDGWSRDFVDELDAQVKRARQARLTPPVLPRRRFLGLVG